MPMSDDVRELVQLAHDELMILAEKISLNSEALRIAGLLAEALTRDKE